MTTTITAEETKQPTKRKNSSWIKHEEAKWGFIFISPWIIGFLLFYLSYRFYGKKHGVLPEMWGARTGLWELLRTFLLALTLFLSYYFLLFTIYYFLHVDYRFLFMGVRAFRPSLIPLLCMYAPLFFVFFLSNSFRVNGAMRFEGEAEWKSMLVAGLPIPWVFCSS